MPEVSLNISSFAAHVLNHQTQPTYPLSQRDKLLDTIAKDVSRTQPRVPFFRSLVEPSRYNPVAVATWFHLQEGRSR